MTRLERLKEKEVEVRRKWMQLMAAGRVSEAQREHSKMLMLQDEIKEAEAYAPRRLSEQLPTDVLDKSGLCELIVKTHMAADFFYDVCFDFRSKMDKLGFADCSLYPMIKQMEKLACDYAALVCHPEFAGLQDFLLTDDELIDGLHKVLDDYMAKHLKITYNQDKSEKINYDVK